MKKKLQRIFICFLTLTLSSCFELHEELKFEPDGTGRYSLILDLSPGKAMIESEQNLTPPTLNEELFIRGLDSALDLGVSDLNRMRNIFGAEKIRDEENMLWGMKFSFNNTEALNSALQKLQKNLSPSESDKEFFAWDGKQLVRKDPVYLHRLLSPFREFATDSSSVAFKKEYTEIYTNSAGYTFALLSDSKIKKFENERAIRLENGSLIYKFSFRDLLERKINTEDKVRIK